MSVLMSSRSRHKRIACGPFVPGRNIMITALIRDPVRRARRRPARTPRQQRPRPCPGRRARTFEYARLLDDSGHDLALTVDAPPRTSSLPRPRGSAAVDDLLGHHGGDAAPEDRVRGDVGADDRLLGSFVPVELELVLVDERGLLLAGLLLEPLELPSILGLPWPRRAVANRGRRESGSRNTRNSPWWSSSDGGSFTTHQEVFL